MSRPSRLRGVAGGRRRRRPVRRRAVRSRWFQKKIEDLVLARQEQYVAGVAEQPLVRFELLHEGVELGVFCVGLVADLVGLDLGLALEDLLGGAGLRERVAGLALGLALDVLGQFGALALVVGDLLVPLAADAVEDGVADLRRVVE